MKVLIACEFSGVVRESFLRLGHDAWSCDLMPSMYYKAKDGRHIVGDCRPLLKQLWDLVIAHPPCTYLCNSGVRWLANNPTRYKKMLSACIFFNECLQSNSDKVAVENPIPHGEA